MQDVSPVSIVSRFNARINAANLDGSASMLTDDHRFIDSAGAIVSGRAAVIAAWTSFFKAFPDYRNAFAQHKVYGPVVAVGG